MKASAKNIAPGSGAAGVGDLRVLTPDMMVTQMRELDAQQVREFMLAAQHDEGESLGSRAKHAVRR